MLVTCWLVNLNEVMCMGGKALILLLLLLLLINGRLHKYRLEPLIMSISTYIPIIIKSILELINIISSYNIIWKVVPKGNYSI